jgi:putative spermidine/putrescine transport system substrate-binding protein
MKKTLALTTILSSLACAATAQELTVMSFGGAYGAAQTETHVMPFAAATGFPARMVDSDNPAAPLKAMIEAGNVTVDAASVEYADAMRMCDEGMLEPIDATILADGADGTPAADDFLPGALTECGVGTDIWATIIAYDESKFPGEKPQTMADLFDLEKFPGKRGLKRNAKSILEMALMGDGVPPQEVYELLSTEEGLTRAFAKLDTIKSDVVWWEAGAQPQQLLADGEVVITVAYNGRVFDAIVNEGKPFKIIWDGQIYDYQQLVVPKGAPNKDKAMEFITFATTTENFRAQAELISYGPPRKSANLEPLIYKDGKTEMGVHLPTNPDNMKNALLSSAEFWADRDAELNERFQAWLVQ